MVQVHHEAHHLGDPCMHWFFAVIIVGRMVVSPLFSSEIECNKSREQVVFIEAASVSIPASQILLSPLDMVSKNEWSVQAREIIKDRKIKDVEVAPCESDQEIKSPLLPTKKGD